ncbi:MAG: homoserine dehydrogenase [Breznakia sp.]
MNIAILGFGVVGGGVYNILNTASKRHLKAIQVTRIFTHPTKGLPMEISSMEDIVCDPDISCVVETLGGIHPAYELICACLRHKKHVVSANKAVIAKHLDEFLTLAKQHHVQFLFEASVGGGVPWLESIKKAKRIDTLQHFHGIFNGTSNYILDCMTHQSLAFDKTLKSAQTLGYAEANPSADIDGYDVQNKIVISCAIAFDRFIDVDSIPIFTLRNITLEDIQYAKKHNYIIKYMGEATLRNHTIEACAMPYFISNTSLEANTHNNYNIASLYGNSIGKLSFYGQGAGSLPTANAIIQDILNIRTAQLNTFSLTPASLDSSITKHNYIIRSDVAFVADNIRKQEVFSSYYYTFTNAITLQTLHEMILPLKGSIWIAKIANFKE